MELYTDTSYELSRQLTQRYSTSFGMSSRLFSSSVRPHIYAIYGMVRLADEIVDTYRGDDVAEILDTFEQTVYAACESGYSTNPIVHAFGQTAREYDITSELIAPFFESMRTDLTRRTYDQEGYERYIYGSAEVIGLMCLRVFCSPQQYEVLKDGACALGSAYQKVNFLRDMAADYKELGRTYFPGAIRYETFDEADKAAIIADIEKDFTAANDALAQLPRSAKRAVLLSRRYYTSLLKRIKKTPAETLKTTRIRVPTTKKLALLTGVWLGL